MYNVDEIMDMLDWNNPRKIQEQGRKLAKDVKCFHVFLQPGYPQYNKNVWDNCAMIIAEKSDAQLRPYLSKLFEWLEDMNWPGAFCIWDRLKRYEDEEWLNSELLYSIDKAKALKRRMWLDNLMEFQGEKDSLPRSESSAMCEKLAKRVYEALVEESADHDKVLYETIQISDLMPEYRRKRFELYNALNDEQRDVFMNAIKNAKADAIHSLFLMMEGLGNIEDRRQFQMELKINGVHTDDTLANTFYRVAEEQGKIS